MSLDIGLDTDSGLQLGSHEFLMGHGNRSGLGGSLRGGFRSGGQRGFRLGQQRASHTGAQQEEAADAQEQYQHQPQGDDQRGFAPAGLGRLPQKPPAAVMILH